METARHKSVHISLPGHQTRSGKSTSESNARSTLRIEMRYLVQEYSLDGCGGLGEGSSEVFQGERICEGVGTKRADRR